MGIRRIRVPLSSTVAGRGDTSLKRITDQSVDQGGGARFMEFVIFAMVIGIMAAVVVPQFSSAKPDGQTAALRSHLATIRAQLRWYQEQHEGQWPSGADCAAQMTSATDVGGLVLADAKAEGRCGPYLQRIPANPFTGGRRIGCGAVGTSDWYYDPLTGEFRANDSLANTQY